MRISVLTVAAGLTILTLATAPAAAQDVIFSPGLAPGTESAWSLDELLLRELIAGDPPSSAEITAVLASIGRSYGLPVATRAGTFLFALDCGAVDQSLTGDFNGWSPDPMNRHGELCWSEVTIPAPDDAGYKYFATDWVADPMARRYRYDEFGELSLVRSSTAHLERWFGFGPEVGLDPRMIRVWVPAGGAFDHTLYAQDGQNLFDPDAIFGGWRLQEHLPAAMLAVGIDNTADRIDEYTPYVDDIGSGPMGGQGDTYADLVHTVIRPFVESRYGGAPSSGLLGSSLGGLISLHIANRFPGEYEFAASMSGTLGWGSIGPHNQTIIEHAVSAGHGTTALYLDSGGGGTTCADSDADGIHDDDPASSDNYCETLQMRDVLLSAGYTIDTDLWYVWDAGASHNEAAWSARVDFPLTVFDGL